MLPAHFNPTGRPLVWAHRGASAEAPENTVAAFSLALAQGADGIELDAQRCASGEVIVLHDESLLRTTGFGALVTDASYSVVRTLDAGSWKSERFRGERIPLLAEALEAFPGLVNVELKCDRRDDGGLTAEVVHVVRAARAGKCVVLRRPRRRGPRSSRGARSFPAPPRRYPGWHCGPRRLHLRCPPRPCRRRGAHLRRRASSGCCTG